jgi:LPXTG-site transpeptidase (sortase) family protein
MPTKIVNPESNHLSLITKIGYLLVVAAAVIFILNYFPVITQEINYISTQATSSNKVDGVPNVVIPADTEFGIVVPKIGANTNVIADVDPFDSIAYQNALTRGVAHAKGTATTGNIGNVFLFAHSSDNFFNANRYNSIFYLLHRLEKGDTFEIYYKGERYEYEVSDKKIADPKDIQYMDQPKDEKVATLMTCWPPGTTLNRLIVVGKQL